MKVIIVVLVFLIVLFSCTKENQDIEQRQQTYYTSVVFNYPVRIVDSITLSRWIWPQVVENPLNFSFTIISGRQSDGPMKVVSWKVVIDGVTIKQSASKRDFSYPQVVTIDVPNTGITSPYRGDISKTWHLISVFGKHSDGSDFADGIYFYE